uniref:Prominin 1 n=1 Tax=Sus scrofa TaxID=9823 RepID=A0A8D1D3E3_PIG
MAPVLGFLLLLGLCGDTVSEGPLTSTDRSVGLKFEFPPVKYETEESYEAGPINILFQIVHVFLHLVQPNPFPEDILRKVIQKKFDLSKDYEKIIYYEIGIIICAVLGLLFIILMPLVGLIFCSCRCCNKCGGEMHQRQKKNGNFLRKYFAVSLLVICLLISIGIIYGFVANQHMRTHIGKTWKLSESNFKDLRTFLNTTPEQIDYIAEQYTTTKERVFSDLDNIKVLLGSRIYQQLKPKLIPMLDDAMAIGEELKTLRESLVQANLNLMDTKQSLTQLGHNLSDVRRGLEQTLSDSTCHADPVQTTCNDIRSSLGLVNVSINPDQLPSLEEHINNLTAVLRTNLTALAHQGYNYLYTIPERVQNETVNIIADVKRALNSIGSNIETASQEFPIRDRLSHFTSYLKKAEDYIHRYLRVLEEYDLYRWLGCLVACCLLTLIATFYSLGLLCGTYGYDQSASPTGRGFISNTGGVFLMVGVGFSFFFCWLLMTLVVLSFVLGANMEKLVCEPYQSKKLFQVLDTPYLLKEDWKYYLSGMIFDNSDIQITFEQVYSDCKENKSIYATLKLEHAYNITDQVNITKYTGDIYSSFENMNISIKNVMKVDEEGRRNLRAFHSLELDKVDYAAIMAETAKPPTQVNLLTFADNLDAKASNLTPGNLKNSLRSHAETLRRIHDVQVVLLQRLLSAVYQCMQELQQKTTGLGVRMQNILFFVNDTQNFVTNLITAVVHEERRKYVTTILSYFEQYLQWVKHSVTEQIAACKPVATALDSVVNIFLCGYVIDPLNLFWFGIGKATVLLLPALIFAVKLAKYYRRMDSEDVYEDGKYGKW